DILGVHAQGAGQYPLRQHAVSSSVSQASAPENLGTRRRALVHGPTRRPHQRQESPKYRGRPPEPTSAPPSWRRGTRRGDLGNQTRSAFGSRSSADRRNQARNPLLTRSASTLSLP